MKIGVIFALLIIVNNFLIKIKEEKI